MECPDCNHVNRAGSRFCTACGIRLPATCLHCGAVNIVSARFCGDCGARLAEHAASSIKPSSPSPTSASAATFGAERRQLTVMFCDLVGSTGLSARLDPEDMSDVIAQYREVVSEAVARFDGFVARYLGDGVLAYFGYPEAHEDDAERAVRSGLAATAAVGRLKDKAGVKMRAHVGIATGLVLVGERIQAGDAQERDAIGETPNLAARLQGMAAPGEVVISANTRRLVGRLFDCRSLGPVEVKGFQRPIEAWQVRGEATDVTRFDAMHVDTLSPLVGRQAELELLLLRWEQAKIGEGCVVFLSGEAGIGKSRLTRALEQRAADDAHHRVAYHCSPYHRDDALFPVVGQLASAAGFAKDDDSQIKLDKLEALLARSSLGREEDAAVLAALLSIPASDRFPLPSLTPQQLKEHTLNCLLANLRALCANQPVLMVVEDLHWVDPTTFELLTRVVESAPELPLLLLVTARDDLALPWPDKRHVSSIGLSRLDRSDVEALVADVLGGKSLPEGVFEQIIQRTDGVPLFIEELTKTLLESGLLRERSGHYELAGQLPAQSIPSTLHASLLARLDRLAAVKDVAQIGATIGREFSFELIVAVAALPESELRLALERLTRAELLYQVGTLPHATFIFKHALVQDAAYASLVRDRRKQLHYQIARVLETSPSNSPTDRSILLAHHYFGAGEYDKAVAGWKSAAGRAIAHSALVEAANLLQQAIDALKHLNDTADRPQLELDLTLELASVMRSLHGYASPLAEKHYLRSREICLQLAEASKRFSIEWGLFQCYFVKGEMKQTAEIASSLLEHARHHPDRPLIDAQIAQGMVQYQTGDLEGARESFEAAAAIARPTTDEPHFFTHGQNSGVFCASYLARTLWLLGYPDQARRIVEQNVVTARARADDPAHLHSYVNALASAVGIYINRREPAAVKEFGELLMSIARRGRYSYYEAMVAVDLAWAVSVEDDPEGGIVQFQRSLPALERTGTVNLLPVYYGRLADLLCNVGRYQEAMRVLEQAQTPLGSRIWDAEIERIKGRVQTLMPGRLDAAAAALQSALKIAQLQRARSLELRAATNYAYLLQLLGRAQAGCNLLEQCLATFDEGWETQDLRDARSLLSNLTQAVRTEAGRPTSEVARCLR